MALIIHMDGGSRGNPGPAGAGVVIRTDSGQLIYEAGFYLGHQTNNAAEYHALIRALERAMRCEPQPLWLYSDSELLVRQMTGQYEVKSPRLAPLHHQAQLLLLRTANWLFRGIPREENRRADQLANLAMDHRRDVVVFDIDGGGGGEPPSSGAGGTAAPLSPEATVSGPAVAPRPDAGLETDGEHAVRVTLARAPRTGGCPAGGGAAHDFTVSRTLPVGLCVYAAQALLPTVLGILHTHPQEFAAVPTLTVHCPRAGCGAIFHVSPARSPNGRSPTERA